MPATAAGFWTAVRQEAAAKTTKKAAPVPKPKAPEPAPLAGRKQSWLQRMATDTEFAKKWRANQTGAKAAKSRAAEAAEAPPVKPPAAKKRRASPQKK